MDGPDIYDMSSAEGADAHDMGSTEGGPRTTWACRYGRKPCL
jgi:hypothetical protein